MPTITVPRTDVTAEKLCKVLRDGLGAGYNVLPGMAMGRPLLAGPHQQPDTILVGKGSNRIVKADITMSAQGGQTVLTISPGGFTADLILNSLGVARKVRDVLANAPDLRLRKHSRPLTQRACIAVTASGGRVRHQRQARQPPGPLHVTDQQHEPGRGHRDARPDRTAPRRSPPPGEMNEEQGLANADTPHTAP
jgi:hypothetical protein